jgi:hypothetical protein
MRSQGRKLTSECALDACASSIEIVLPSSSVREAESSPKEAPLVSAACASFGESTCESSQVSTCARGLDKRPTMECALESSACCAEIVLPSSSESMALSPIG